MPGIGCGSPRPLGYTHATQLLNDGVPFHVVQRYLGHQRPEMTARYAATLAATAAAEFLKPSTPRGVQSDTCRQPIRSGLTQRERRGQGCRGADGPGPSQLFAPRYSGVTSIEAAGNGMKRLLCARIRT